MNDIKETLDQIDRVISEYNGNSGEAGIDDLLQWQDELATLSWNLAEICGQAKKNYTFSYLARKIAVNKQAQSLVKKKIETAWTKATARAEVMTEDLYKQEVEAEAQAYVADLKLKQVNKILSSMQQRISHVKKLWELDQFTTNAQ